MATHLGTTGRAEKVWGGSFHRNLDRGTHPTLCLGSVAAVGALGYFSVQFSERKSVQGSNFCSNFEGPSWVTGMGQNMKGRKSAYSFVGLLLFLQATRDSSTFASEFSPAPPRSTSLVAASTQRCGARRGSSAPEDVSLCSGFRVGANGEGIANYDPEMAQKEMM